MKNFRHQNNDSAKSFSENFDENIEDELLYEGPSAQKPFEIERLCDNMDHNSLISSRRESNVSGSSMNRNHFEDEDKKLYNKGKSSSFSKSIVKYNNIDLVLESKSLKAEVSELLREMVRLRKLKQLQIIQSQNLNSQIQPKPKVESNSKYITMKDISMHESTLNKAC